MVVDQDKGVWRQLRRYVLRLRDRYYFSEEEAREAVLSRQDSYGKDIEDHRRVIYTFDKAWASRRKSFLLTELGNAERLVNQYGEDLQYCQDKELWYIWDGTRWAEDKTKEEVTRMAKRTVRGILHEAENLPSKQGSLRDKMLEHWKRSEKVSALNNMIKAAPIEKGIAVTSDQLDSDKWLLNCKNGVLDLRTGELREHKREDLITKIIPVEYDPKARCPTWKDFISEITDDDRFLRDYLMRIVGYGLTGEIGEKCLFFLYGPTDTGKTTFIETIRTMMGDYAKTSEFQTFLSSRNKSAIRNDIARLEKARFVSASEAAKDQVFDEPVIKLITGGDTVIARFLYKEFFEFKPEFKIFLASNHLPKVSGGDDAIWNRILVVPFQIQIPQEKQDKDLRKKFEREMPGILNWAISGNKRYQTRGMPPPQKVVDAVRRYRDESDILLQFISERCEVEKDAFEKTADLFEAWREWCKEMRIGEGTKNSFGRAMTNYGFKDKPQYIDGKQCRVRMGLRLRK
jgi:putative DNA primase/helicase